MLNGRFIGGQSVEWAVVVNGQYFKRPRSEEEGLWNVRFKVTLVALVNIESTTKDQELY